MKKYKILKRSDKSVISPEVRGHILAEQLALGLWEITQEEMILECDGEYFNVKTGNKIPQKKGRQGDRPQ